MTQDGDNRIVNVFRVERQEAFWTRHRRSGREAARRKNRNGAMVWRIYPFCKLWCQRVLSKDVKGDPLQAEEEG